MKSGLKLLTLAAVSIALLSWNNSSAQEKAINWKLVSKNLVRSLASENDGLRQSAMDFFVKHSDKLDINDAVYSVMNVYRNHDDLRMRKLALVTLYKMQNKWAMEFLKVDLRFQDSQELKRMVAAILQEHEGKKKAS
ncbi:hypothetical protein HUU05_26440 [candidate division KSB1 bacterium]|nr:hypothetical protein [candidate division KSB1 bacterium]